MKKSFKQSEVATIRNTARRAKAEGIGVGESAIRRLVKSGELPHIKVGNRTYISWNALTDLLQRGFRHD